MRTLGSKRTLGRRHRPRGSSRRTITFGSVRMSFTHTHNLQYVDCHHLLRYKSSLFLNLYLEAPTTKRQATTTPAGC